MWIGFNTCILPGVTIGEGAIVGARSLVLEDVAPYTVVGGNPARFIRRLDLDKPLLQSPVALGRKTLSNWRSQRITNMTSNQPNKGKIIVFGILFWYPLAGVTYQFLHYLIGLRRLGYDPYYIEDSGR